MNRPRRPSMNALNAAKKTVITEVRKRIKDIFGSRLTCGVDDFLKKTPRNSVKLIGQQTEDRDIKVAFAIGVERQLTGEGGLYSQTEMVLLTRETSAAILNSLHVDDRMPLVDDFLHNNWDELTEQDDPSEADDDQEYRDEMSDSYEQRTVLESPESSPKVALLAFYKKCTAGTL